MASSTYAKLGTIEYSDSNDIKQNTNINLKLTETSPGCLLYEFYKIYKKTKISLHFLL